MNAAERLELIRARLGGPKPQLAKPKGLHCSATGDASSTKGPPRKYVRQAKGIGSTFGFFQRTDERHKGWVREADSVPHDGFNESFRHGAHQLTKIAGKWESLKRKNDGTQP